MRGMKAGSFVVAAGLFFATMATANGQTPIKDKDAFEKKYIECIMAGLKNKCFSTLLGGRLVPDGRGRELDKIDEIANQFWPVHQVYPLDKTIRAGVWDNRTYLIEHSNNRFSCAYINFVKAKGEWYVDTFGLNSSLESLRKLLKLPEDW